MRLRRTILLSLGPLISLWALGVQGVVDPLASESARQRVAAQSLQQFFQPVVSFLILAAEHASTTANFDRPAPRALLALEALGATPLGRSLWLVRSKAAVDLLARRHRSLPLRC